MRVHNWRWARRSPARLSLGLGTALGITLSVTSSVASAAPLLDEPTKALIVDAVEAAFELDLYNSRCRQDRSGRRTENLNKALASGLRMTVIDAQDDLFPEGYYRDAQARMTRDFLEQLRALGGCAGAKEAKLRDALRKRYEQAMERLEQFP
jgi:Spy/CpxP family protein refolding chaperone